MGTKILVPMQINLGPQLEQTDTVNLSTPKLYLSNLSYSMMGTTILNFDPYVLTQRELIDQICGTHDTVGKIA